ncbi:MAG: hypothetical protein FWG88_11210 [Oscillospiraceae bacterium]|nr:hypothetical protein [Oscillospiraceae bacterium]
MSEHNHDHNHSQNNHASRLNQLKSATGSIYIKRMMHDEATVISGSLTVVTQDPHFTEIVAEALETAGAKITELGGIIGHIKATTTTTNTKMISVTDESAMIKEAIDIKVVIIIAAIVFLVDEKTAGDIIRQALVSVRKTAKG